MYLRTKQEESWAAVEAWGQDPCEVWRDVFERMFRSFLSPAKRMVAEYINTDAHPDFPERLRAFKEFKTRTAALTDEEIKHIWMHQDSLPDYDESREHDLDYAIEMMGEFFSLLDDFDGGRASEDLG